MRKFLTDIADLIGERLFGKKRPAKQPELNRAQRRDLEFRPLNSPEAQMRRMRTYIAQAKRRKSKRGDHGAKARRAYLAGLTRGVEYFNVRIQQAYAAGLAEGRRQTSMWSWLPGRKAAS